MSVSRSTISFDQVNWSKLKNEKNKSRVVNAALRFFYDSKKAVEKAETDFILSELAHYEETGESYSADEVFN